MCLAGMFMFRAVRMEAIDSMVPLATVTRDASILRSEHSISVNHGKLSPKHIANSMTIVMVFQRKPKLSMAAELDTASRGDYMCILD